MRVHGLMIVAVALLIAADKAENNSPAGKKELKKLEGTWVAVALEKDGLKLSAEEVKKGGPRLTVKGSKFTIKQPGETVNGTFTLDPTAKPPAVDIVPADGPSKGMTMQGIYELKGDVLKACYDTTCKGRPEKFSTKDKEGWILIVYKRVKASK